MRDMSAAEMWVESYQGEVLGATLFGLLAEREADPERRHQLEVLSALEVATKELAEPMLDRHGIDRGDTEGSVTTARALADGLAETSWTDFLISFESITDRFLGIYRQLVELATDDDERGVAEAYVAHEEALATYARRALGQEGGAPLDPVLAVPHLAAAMGAGR
jgi:hypothetical protein